MYEKYYNLQQKIAIMFSKLEHEINTEITLSSGPRAQIHKYDTPRNLVKNEYLLKGGEVCNYGYFINSGSLVQAFLSPNGPRYRTIVLCGNV